MCRLTVILLPVIACLSQILFQIEALDPAQGSDQVFYFPESQFDVVPTYTPDEERRINPIDMGTNLPNGEPDPSCQYDPELEVDKRRNEMNTTGKRVSEIQCEYHMLDYKYRVLELARQIETCKNKTYGFTGVINGQKAAQNEYPHMGAVGWRTVTDSYTFLCGCSLISLKFALTAAHCSAMSLRSLNEFTSPEIVRFGNIYIGPETEGKPQSDGVDAIIEQFIPIKEFKFAFTKYNDIALIKLQDDIDISVNVRPACLYQYEHISHTTFTVTGWGVTENGSQSDFLLYGEVDVYDRAECINFFKSKAQWLGLKDHQICAGKKDGSIDTCQGDSGGPLQIKEPLPDSLNETGVMYKIVGVTSNGVNCGLKNHPGLYTKVSDPHFLCWIEKKVWPEMENSFCPEDKYDGYKYI